MKNIKNAIMHFRKHQTYPATKADLVEACNNMADFSDTDKQWFSKNLPDKTYNSAEEVMKAIGISDAQIHAAM